MMTGTTSPSSAPRSERTIPPSENFVSLFGKWRCRALTQTRAIRATATSTPGTTPIKNSLPTEMPPP